MPLKSKRYPRTEYTKGVRVLPRALAFLDRATYLAVVEHAGDNRTQYSVEVKPSILRRLLEAEDLLKDLQQQLIQATEEHQTQMVGANAEIVGLRQDISEAETYIERLEANNTVLMSKLDQTPDERPEERSAKSHMNRVQEHGLRPGMRGISGGLPSLGKRK